MEQFWMLWIAGLVLVFIFLYIITQLRKVVPTNEVHIVQKWSSSVPFWRDFEWGNVYLDWPGWVPMVWIFVQKLPLSIFDIKLEWYQAYDSGKVPFQVDVTAFFVIKDPVTAAQKIYTIMELQNQLSETLKWVIRKTLASKDIIDIMESRIEIKQEFHAEILKEAWAWWVELKNVEFMDIRDADDSEVVANIMNKKRSQIEAESQIEVAENEKRSIIERENKAAEARAKASEAKSKADIIEFDAQRASELKKIENDQLTQNLNIEKEKMLTLQKEEAKQKFFEAEKITKQKELEIKQLEQEKNAEISKNIEIIKAEEQKQKMIIDAQAKKESVELEAQWEKNRIEAVWLAKAKEIDFLGTAQAKNKAEMAKALNEFSLQAIEFMMKELDVKLSEVVDLEKAKSLAKADIKIISTGPNGWEWVNSFMELFSAKWGTNIWAMIEAAKNTLWEEKVNEFINKFTSGNTQIKEKITPKIPTTPSQQKV